MKKKYAQIGAVALCLLLAVMLGGLLLTYVRPVDDVSVDLYVGPPREEAVADPFPVVDTKGWTVFTQEGDVKTELTHNEYGLYSGTEPGQTFYYSRVMKEKAAVPVLQITPTFSYCSVWLDGELIYSDVDNVDNRIGYLHLPAYVYSEGKRSEPLFMQLPEDYLGKTLTIAESVPEQLDSDVPWAILSEVRFYCDFADESARISEGYQMALFAGAAFCLFLILMFTAVWNRKPELLCMALVAALWMLQILTRAAFFGLYAGEKPPVWVQDLFSLLSALAVFVFLSLRCGKCRLIQWIMTGLCGLSIIVYVMFGLISPEIPATNRIATFFASALPYWIAVATTIVSLVLYAVFWKKNSWFCRVFVPIAVATLVLSVLYAYHVSYRLVFWDQLNAQFEVMGLILFSMIQPAISAAAVIASLAEIVRDRWNRHKEVQKILLKHREASGSDEAEPMPMMEEANQ